MDKPMKLVVKINHIFGTSKNYNEAIHRLYNVSDDPSYQHDLETALDKNGIVSLNKAFRDARITLDGMVNNDSEDYSEIAHVATNLSVMQGQIPKNSLDGENAYTVRDNPKSVMYATENAMSDLEHLIASRKEV